MMEKWRIDIASRLDLFPLGMIVNRLVGEAYAELLNLSETYIVLVVCFVARR